MPTRPPVLDETRPSGAGQAPPTALAAPRLPPDLLEGPPPRNRAAFVAFLAFLAGALLVGAAFGTYALGNRDNRVNAVNSAKAPSAPAGLNVRAILDKAQPSVVSITTGSKDGIFGGAGSGVVLTADGLVLTNAHVIATSGGKISVRFHDGQVAQATIVGASTRDDLALLQVDRQGLTPATLGSSANLRVGDDVVAIGNALALGDEPSVTKGIVSAKNRSISEGKVSLTNLIQTDAAINPGNSGGPLVNAAGEVVGINTAIIDGAQSVGFSIAIDSVKAMLPKLQAGEGDIDPNGAVLGVATVTVDSSLSKELKDRYKVTASAGALISQIDPASAASEAGLQVGDVIVEIEGVATGTKESVANEIKSYQKGDRVKVTVERDGTRRTFEVTLGPR